VQNRSRPGTVRSRLTTGVLAVTGLLRVFLQVESPNFGNLRPGTAGVEGPVRVKPQSVSDPIPIGFSALPLAIKNIASQGASPKGVADNVVADEGKYISI